MASGQSGSGAAVNSFAYLSIRDRWPKIITKIIDQLHQRHSQTVKEFGPEGDVDIKEIIHSLSRLRYMVATDKPLEELDAGVRDADVWNTAISEYRKKLGEEKATWYRIPWLFTECYMYRLIFDFFQRSKHLKEYDPFRIDKQQGYFDCQAHLLALGTELVKVLKTSTSEEETKLAISRYLQISLWGNKADLSLTGGDPHFMAATIFHELEDLRKNILVDHLDPVVDFLTKEKRSVGIVLDNAGLELFTDLCLATLLVCKEHVSKVTFYGKAFPWYVSDVTRADMDWLVRTTAEHEDEALRELGGRWRSLFEQGTFEYATGTFFTLGLPYCEMAARDPELHTRLSSHCLLIFKGDLNYRKLVRDCDWEPTTPFNVSSAGRVHSQTAVNGFEPTKFVSLRTLKAETVAGLDQGTLRALQNKFGAENKSWMISSDYAVVQALL